MALPRVVKRPDKSEALRKAICKIDMESHLCVSLRLCELNDTLFENINIYLEVAGDHLSAPCTATVNKGERPVHPQRTIDHDVDG